MLSHKIPYSVRFKFAFQFSYRQLLSLDPQGYIPYRYRAAVCRFELDGLPLLVLVKVSTEYITHEFVPTSPAESDLSGSSSFDSFLWRVVGGRMAAVLWDAVYRTLSILLAAFLSNCCQALYIYIYLYIYTNFVEHNRHFLSIYFPLDPFVLLYCFYRIRRELIYVFSIIVYIPSTFCPSLGHHQERIYYKRDITFVFAYYYYARASFQLEYIAFDFKCFSINSVSS